MRRQVIPDHLAFLHHKRTRSISLMSAIGSFVYYTAQLYYYSVRIGKLDEFSGRK